MAEPFRLQVLLDLSRDRLETASVELQRLRQHWAEAQGKLEQLTAYQSEYGATLKQRLSAGIPASLFSDYRLFLDKLARAMVIDPSTLSGDKVVFGATVHLLDEDDKPVKYQIVGQTEADAKSKLTAES